MQLVYFLEDIQPQDVDIHGGKATNLAKLAQFGFLVPRTHPERASLEKAPTTP